MAANSFGQRFVVHTFGESHGQALGALIDGCPAGIEFDEKVLLAELQRRRPGNWNTLSGEVVSPRKEEDVPEILSGVFAGKTLGTPICMVFRNQDARSQDYDEIKHQPRTGHADDVWRDKYHHVDHRGGGRASGRETVSRVAAGAVARMLIKRENSATQIKSFLSSIGSETYTESEFPSQRMLNQLLDAQNKGDSLGAVVALQVLNPPLSLGQPVFHKLKADLASAIMSIGGVTGIELGDGFRSGEASGIDFHSKRNYGGIRGGLSTGETIVMRIAVKPTSSIQDVAKKGRHDPCIAVRALPVIEAMVALVMADHILWKKTDR